MDNRECRECGVDLKELETEIRKLRERLEYSELQNLKLSSECKRLNKELREAAFRSGSTISPHCVPGLPDEVLQYIFQYAVHLDDLVSPFWNGYDAYLPWKVSSRTRRSIPLVCRQWHRAGLEYLYKHIVLSRPPQIKALKTALQCFSEDPERCERKWWIRGIEFVMWSLEVSRVREVSEMALQLIDLIPEGRITAFGLEDGECDRHQAMKLIEKVVAAGLEKSRGCLETLHVPCIREETGSTGMLAVVSESSAVVDKTSNYTGFSCLRNLSLTSGWWEYCGGVQRLDHRIIRFLTRNPHSLRSLSINLENTKERTGKLLEFLAACTRLESITVIVGPSTKLLSENMYLFLQATPNLRHLLIGASNRRNRPIFPIDSRDYTHMGLEQITLIMSFASNSCAMRIFQPLINGIRMDSFPALKRVTVRGTFPGGCIDGRDVFSAKYLNNWKNLIASCAERDVELVNDQGDAVYLWEDRHGIGLGPFNSGSGSTVSCSDDERRWRELSASESGGPPTSSSVSCDSGDMPYRYVSQPDLDYDTDSEDSEDFEDVTPQFDLGG